MVVIGVVLNWESGMSDDPFVIGPGRLRDEDISGVVIFDELKS